MNTKYIITNENITLYYDNNVYTLNKQSKQHPLVVKCLLAGNYDKASSFMNLKEGIVRKIANSDLVLKGNQLYWKEKQLNNYVTKKIIALMGKNRKIDLLVAFLNKLMLNPIPRVQDELLQFLEYGKLPICTDGDFLAYKRVNEDYRDYHSGQCDYTPGKTVKMKRKDCDTNSNNVCSTGLHFCSFEYLNSFSGDKIIVVKINPKNVMSIPKDYNNTKGRACEIQSICEYNEDCDIDKLKTLDFVKVKKGKQDMKNAVKSIRSKKEQPINVVNYKYNNSSWQKRKVNEVKCPFCKTMVKAATSTFESSHGKVCPKCGSRLARRKAYKF